MKKILLLFLLAAAALPARAETCALGDHGKLTVTLDETWKIKTEDMGDHFEITLEPKGDANAGCKLTVSLLEKDEFNTRAKLRDRVIEGCEETAEHSLEGKASPKEFYLKSGFGYYCSFTDKDLVGKAPEKGNFRVITIGLIHLTKDLGVSVTILADDFKADDYQQLLGAVEGMEYEPAKDADTK